MRDERGGTPVHQPDGYCTKPLTPASRCRIPACLWYTLAKPQLQLHLYFTARCLVLLQARSSLQVSMCQHSIGGLEHTFAEGF